ncbi:MAG: hypothetical protein H7Y09_03880 [Chitinophagaceae bacterium]|nr:hypothetical protein [Anaerolineae bacterium]
MNNRRGTFILFAIFVILTGIVLLQPNVGELLTRNNAPTAEPISPFSRVYPDLAVLEIRAIQLQSPVTNESFTMARTADGSWTSPDLDAALDQEQASNIAQTLVLLPYTYTTPLPENGNLEQFGFRPYGAFLILASLNDGSEHAIAIGDPLQSGPEFYACVDDSCSGDSPEVYIVQRAPIDYLVNFMQNPPLAGETTATP